MFRSNEVIAIVDLFNLDGRMVQIHPVWDHRIDRHAAFGHYASAIVSFPAATRFARFSSSRSKNFELYGLYQVKNSLSGSSKTPRHPWERRGLRPEYTRRRIGNRGYTC